MLGTEFLDPLEKIFSQRIIDGYKRQVFVLTDAAVTNFFYRFKSIFI